jgi:hypothetical protein
LSAADKGVEEARNRLLRRADWRFLLPDASPARTVCFVDGELSGATELISHRVLEAEALANCNCELAVAVDADAATLRSAWAALRPGGVCYTEWSRAGVWGTSAVRQRLSGAGFESVTCFAPWPRPVRRLPSAWVPLEAAGPLRHLVTRGAAGRSWARRFLEGLRRAAWIVRTRLGQGSPICAVARKPSTEAAHHPGGEPAPQPELLEEIRHRWEGWGLGPRPSTLSWILLTSGRRSINKVVRLVFAGSDRPRLVLKMPRVAEAAAGLAREASVLRELQSSGREIRGVPKLLFEGVRAGVPTIVETALPGVPLPTRLRRETYRDLALLGTDWLVAFAGQAEAHPPTAWHSRLIDTTVGTFEASFGGVVDPGLVRESAAVLATLGPLPIVCEQRDFSPWNLLISSEEELQVLDWESAEPQGLPVMDLVYFTSHLAFYLAGARTPERCRECYRETLWASTFTGAVRQECQERYAERVGVRAADIAPLRLLCWMVHSRSEYRRFAADIGGVPQPTQLRQSLFLSLWEEELQDLLQTGPLGPSRGRGIQPPRRELERGGSAHGLVK